MKNPGQFGTNPAATPISCAAAELLWTEAAEGNLPPATASALELHLAGCTSCREKLVQTSQGREWLLILKQEVLIPPASLVDKILASTTEAESLPSRTRSLPAAANATAFFPPWQHPSAMLRRTGSQSHMVLVAAMAFFSISLTLSLMGVRFTRLRLADFEPQAMRRAVTRQYAEANARIVRYYENLRIVYEVESRIRQLRQAATESSNSSEDRDTHSAEPVPAGGDNQSQSGDPTLQNTLAANRQPHTATVRRPVPAVRQEGREL